MYKILVINPNSNEDVTTKLTAIFRDYPKKRKRNSPEEKTPG